MQNTVPSTRINFGEAAKFIQLTIQAQVQNNNSEEDRIQQNFPSVGKQHDELCVGGWNGRFEITRRITFELIRDTCHMS
jgi:hypothetical protein